MPSLKERLDARKLDLLGNKAKEGQLIEVEAQRLMLADLAGAAEIAKEVAQTAAVGGAIEPTIEDIVLLNNLYQSYVGPAYRNLILRGEVEAPAVPTTPSTVRGKDEFTS